MLLEVDQQDHVNYCGNKEMNNVDRSEDEEGDDDDSEDTNTSPSESEKNNLWTEADKPTAFTNLRQYLSYKLKKNPINKTKSSSDNNPVSNLFKKLTCGSSRPTNVSVTASPVQTHRKPMAYRRCLRIRPSQARHLTTSSHPTLGQVFAPELLQRNSSPISTVSVSPIPSDSEKTVAEATCVRREDAGESRSVLPSVDEAKESSFWAVRLYNSFRKPKNRRNTATTNHQLQIHPNPPNSRSKLNYSSESPVKFLELPAQHQPLIHRYGISQFVLLVDWNDAECKNSNFSVTAAHPLRSVMRKPHRETKPQQMRKKSVKFQDSVSLYSNNSSTMV